MRDKPEKMVESFLKVKKYCEERRKKNCKFCILCKDTGGCPYEKPLSEITLEYFIKEMNNLGFSFL